MICITPHFRKFFPIYRNQKEKNKEQARRLKEIENHDLIEEIINMRNSQISWMIIAKKFGVNKIKLKQYVKSKKITQKIENKADPKVVLASVLWIIQEMKNKQVSKRNIIKVTGYDSLVIDCLCSDPPDLRNLKIYPDVKIPSFYCKIKEMNL